MSEPLGDPFEEGGREPTGLEIDLVREIRGRVAAESEATALRNRLIALGFTREGLARIAAEHRAKLKADVKQSKA